MITLLSIVVNFLVCPIIGPPQFVDHELDGVIYSNEPSGHITYINYSTYPSFSYHVHKIEYLKLKNPVFRTPISFFNSYKYRIPSNISNLQLYGNSVDAVCVDDYIVIKTKKNALTDQFSDLKIEYDEQIRPKVEMKYSTEIQNNTLVVTIFVKNKESFEIQHFWGTITVPLSPYTFTSFGTYEEKIKKHELNTTIHIVQITDIYRIESESEGIFLPYAIKIFEGYAIREYEWGYLNVSVPFGINLDSYESTIVRARISQGEPGKIAISRILMPPPPYYIFYPTETEEGFMTKCVLIDVYGNETEIF